MKSGILNGRGLVLLVVLFLAIQVLAGMTLRGVRADLTENDLYTLTDGSRNIVRQLDEPITLRFFFSRSLLRESSRQWAPYLTAFGTRVRELLEEYVAASDGSLRLTVVDPAPFSEEEDQAVQAGLVGLPANDANDPAYLGLVATNATDGVGKIEFFDPQKEAFLEYELSRLIYKLSDPARPVLALLSSLPLQGGEPAMFPGAPPPEPPWFVLEQLEEFFEVRRLGIDVTAIDEDVDVLMLVHPKELLPEALYAIDQYVLRGGKLVAYLDPHCEEDRPPQDPGNPLAGMDMPRSSDLPSLLAAWGVSYDPERVLADRATASRVAMRTQRGIERVDYVVWPAYGPEHLDQDDPVTSGLGTIRLAAPGALAPAEGARTTFTPLLTSSDDAMLVGAEALRFFPDAKALLRDFAPTGERYVVAARVDGPCESAFPEGPPGGAGPDGGEGGQEDGTAPQGHLSASQGDVHLVLVADVDLLADRSWVQFANLFGTRLAVPEADNGSLAVNAADSLSGSSDLISVRSRGHFKRPFEKLEELRVLAEQEYLAQAQEFEARLAETNRRLAELQRQEGNQGALILTEEQVAEIERLREEQVEVRKKLRDVRHDLRKDIESLQGWLKAANILGVPMILAALGLGLWVYRRR